MYTVINMATCVCVCVYNVIDFGNKSYKRNRKGKWNHNFPLFFFLGGGWGVYIFRYIIAGPWYSDGYQLIVGSRNRALDVPDNPHARITETVLPVAAHSRRQKKEKKKKNFQLDGIVINHDRI